MNASLFGVIYIIKFMGCTDGRQTSRQSLPRGHLSIDGSTLQRACWSSFLFCSDKMVFAPKLLLPATQESFKLKLLFSFLFVCAWRSLSLLCDQDHHEGCFILAMLIWWTTCVLLVTLKNVLKSTFLTFGLHCDWNWFMFTVRGIGITNRVKLSLMFQNYRNW